MLYDVMGHAVFLEDAIEKRNLIQYNLVATVRSSFSLLYTDQIPAAFWVSHPDNYLTGNSAVGSDGHGFWYDIPATSSGAYATTTVCPIGAKLGEFWKNKAHSNTLYGLRIHSGHSPRVDACAAVNSLTNPVLTAEYKDFEAWLNGRPGVIGGDMGAVVFKGLVLETNVLAGFEVEKDANQAELVGYLDGATIIGYNPNRHVVFDEAPHGVITPRTERYWIKNVEFYNFNFTKSDGTQAAAIGTCSKCYSEINGYTDSDARTTFFSGIRYNDVEGGTETQVIRYQHPYKAIIYDADCSVHSGRSQEGDDSVPDGPCWFSYRWRHNERAAWSTCAY